MASIRTTEENTMPKYRCCGCKDRFDGETMLSLPAGRFCETACVIAYVKAAQDRARTKQQARAKREHRDNEKAVKRAHRADKERIKTKSQWTKEAQAAINKYVRIRDSGKPCISCGATPEQKMGGTMDAGHYRSRGAASHLRFNLFNIAGQCVKCNRYNSGNVNDYRIGLIARIGLNRVEALENDNVPRKFSVEYLKRIKTIFNKKARLTQKRIDRAEGE